MQSYRRIVREPDGSRWSVRVYPHGNAISRDPDGRTTYRTSDPSFRDVAGEQVIHWTRLDKNS